MQSTNFFVIDCDELEFPNLIKEEEKPKYAYEPITMEDYMYSKVNFLFEKEHFKKEQDLKSYISKNLIVKKSYDKQTKFIQNLIDDYFDKVNNDETVNFFYDYRKNTNTEYVAEWGDRTDYYGIVQYKELIKKNIIKQYNTLEKIMDSQNDN